MHSLLIHAGYITIALYLINSFVYTPHRSTYIGNILVIVLCMTTYHDFACSIFLVIYCTWLIYKLVIFKSVCENYLQAMCMSAFMSHAPQSASRNLIQQSVQKMGPPEDYYIYIIMVTCGSCNISFFKTALDCIPRQWMIDHSTDVMKTVIDSSNMRMLNIIIEYYSDHMFHDKHAALRYACKKDNDDALVRIIGLYKKLII